MRTIVLALAVLAVNLTGCAHTPAKPEGPSVGTYYPLAVGNSWTYQVKILGESDTKTISITGEENGMFKDSAGNEMTVDAYGVRDQKRYLLRVPLEVGTKWNNVVSVSSYEQYQIIEAGQDCSSPAGQFHDCVTVESRNKADGDKTLVDTLTFAPNVGIVSVATLLDADGKQIPQARLELTAYTVQPAKPAASAPAR
jgi:hypothetical protein